MMVYNFLLLSDEADNFKREIQISSQASFLDFNQAILQATGYEENQIYSFFICDDDWSKKTEITLFEMDTSSEEDSYIMESTLLEELLSEERQKLLFVFDQLTERVLFIELMEIITGKDLKKPVCTTSVGNPPPQFVDFELESHELNTDLGENFYGDDAYDDDDLDGLEDDLFQGDFDDNRF